MMIFAGPGLFEYIHLGCYVLGLFIGFFVATSLDYSKFVRIKSNGTVYLVTFAIALCIAFLIGEFVYRILTLFMV